MSARPRVRRIVSLLFCIGIGLATGCASTEKFQTPPGNNMPRELSKVSLPPYIIEPPDILLVDAIRVVPKAPYHINALDVLFVFCPGAPSEVAGGGVQGYYPVDPGGTVNLGPSYGTVPVVGLTIEEAKAAIEKVLKANKISDSATQVSIAQSRAMQQIRGEHLVKPDGTVSLGAYGAAYVTGMTTVEAKAAIEAQLSKFLEKPEVSVDVLAFNSKVVYVITDGGGFGQAIVRLPVTGNETVLDAIAQINGLPQQASLKKIWIARPAPPGANCGDQILPVDWRGITMCAQTATNYQLLPGDRLFVKADGLIAINNFLTKLLSPVERIMGDVSLGAGAVNTVSTIGRFGTGGTQ